MQPFNVFINKEHDDDDDDVGDDDDDDDDAIIFHVLTLINGNTSFLLTVLLAAIWSRTTATVNFDVKNYSSNTV